jgi:hypothetical protein
MKFINFLISVLFIFFSGLAYSKIIYVDVQVTGIGSSKKDSINNALINAIAQVDGQYMSAHDKQELKHKIEVANDKEKEEISEKFSEEINSYTKGIIKKYKILNIAETKNQLFEATLLVTISSYEKKQLKRLRLSVFPIRINNNIYNNQSIQFIQAWQKDLEEGLTQTRRFAMIDKSYENESGQELNKYKGKEYNIEEMARLGNKAGIDYMIVGTLESLNDKTVNVSDKSIPIREVAISLRIIDVATSQIKYAKTVANAKKAVRDILYAIYPIRVVAVNSKTVTLGSGGDYLKKGTHFQVVKLGKSLIDPYTKEKLGREEIDIGEVVLTEINAKTSKAEIVKGEAEIQRNANNDLILKPVSAAKKKNLVDELDDMNY